MEQKHEVSIQKQLESISVQLAYIREEIDYQKKFREQMQDLQEEISRISKEAVVTTISQLNEISDQVNSEKILNLSKTAARNTDTFSSVIDKIDGFNDLIAEALPIIYDFLSDTSLKLNDYSNNGFFDLLRAFFEFLHKFVGSFKREDLINLLENAELIADTLKNVLSCLTPKLLESVNTTIKTYMDFKAEIPEKISLFKMISLMKSKEIKVFLYASVEFLRTWMNNNQNATVETEKSK